MTHQDFAGFGLAKPLTDALARAGFSEPTPIQSQAIAPQMEGRDIMGIAQTGTGKTAAFALPILHHILAMQGRPSPKSCRALVLAPTRELAVQINDNFRSFAGGAQLSTCLVLGGMSRGGQIKALARGVDVVVATPGRLIDLMDDKCIRLDETRFVVLDEADRMLDMGFVQPVRKIVARLHPRRQSAMFSATMPNEVAKLAAEFLSDPVRIEVTPQATLLPKIAAHAELVEGSKKRPRLAELVSGDDVRRVIVFARTKRGADRVAENLGKDGIAAEAIHGNKAQNARQKALGKFRNGQVKVLVATDIVARGIDVPGVTHIINFDLPDEPENYVHRIGRTGRNGAEGIAITLCAPDELKKLRAVEKVTGVRLLPAELGNGPSGKKPQRGGGRGPGGGHGRQGGYQGNNKPAVAATPKGRRPTRSGRPRTRARAAA